MREKILKKLAYWHANYPLRMLAFVIVLTLVFGWFAEHLISTEDTYAGARMLLAGYTLAYVSDAMVYHSHNYTVFQEFKRYFDIGVFHKKERWILEAFGNAEGTGLRHLCRPPWEPSLCKRLRGLLPYRKQM